MECLLVGIKNDLIKGSAFGSGVGGEKIRKVSRALPKGRPMRWASLHHHSTFSYGDGFGMPDDHALRAADIQLGAMALTEHGNMASHVKFEQAALKAGIKPIFGIEFYMSPGETQRKNHLTVIARDAKGYNNLLRLNTHAYKNFYYYPTLTVPQLASARTGLFVLSGCLGSELATSLIGGKLVDEGDAGYALGRSVARRYRRLFGDSYFLEVQAFPELEQTVRVNKMIARLSRELKIPMVATMDCHYPRPEDRRMQQILHNVRPGEKRTLEDMVRSWGYTVPLCPPERDLHIVTRLVQTGLTKIEAQGAVLASETIAQECNVTLPTLPMVRYPGNSKRVWEEWLETGWSYRGFDLLPAHIQAEYRERLHYEKTIMEQKDYIDYFLIVADAVRFAKDAGIAVGPARGSAAASLVCFLLRITEVNPMLYPNLVFERFVDLSRADMPDVDLDFASKRRGEVYDYLETRYGAGRVGNIGTFTMYKAKNSIDDCRRVFHVPPWEANALKDLLIERSSGDLRASATIEDTVEQFQAARDILDRYPDLVWAMELEGNAKGQGVHAAGLVVANGPITDVCSLLERKVKDEVRQVIELDKYDAERQGLIKMDFLGLSTVDMIGECLDAGGMTLEDLYKLPLDDPKVIDGFRKNDVVGIFQFDGRAMRQVCGALRPDTFTEICDANALARPGPLHSGSTAEYIDTKWGRREAIALHPLLERITASTHHQIVYQEQILRVVREIGNFSWTHASHIRKIISKKLGEQEFNRQWETFLEGAVSNGVDPATARVIWGRCITAGTYAFNAAHCVSYGMIAYWTMYFKVYHPAAFYAAALNNLNDKKRMELLRDAERHGISALAPDPVKSEVGWLAETSSTLRGGLSQVPGIGQKTALAILEARDDGEMNGWEDVAKVKGIGKATVEKIKTFCTIDDPYEIKKLRRSITAVAAQSFKLGIPRPTHTAEEIPIEQGKDVQVVWYGMIAERNLRDIYEAHRSRTGEELDRTTVKDPDLNELVVMIGVDETESVSITVDRWKYPRFAEGVWSIKPMHDIVVVRATKPGRQAARRLYVKEIWVVDPSDEPDESDE